MSSPKSQARYTMKVCEILAESGLNDLDLAKILQVNEAQISEWKSGVEPHYLTKRGIITVLFTGCKQPGKTAIWEIKHPDGAIEQCQNMQEWCRRNGFGLHVASSFSSRGFYGGKSNRYYAKRY